MYPYAPLPRRAWPGTHPTLGALLGFVLLVLAVPFALPYGLLGFGGVLFLAGVLAGAVARGGARMGVGTGGRAVAAFMLLLLVSWTVLLLNEGGYLNLTANPDLAELVPYVALAENLWVQVSNVMYPLLSAILVLVGGDMLVDLLLRVVLPTLPAAVGGALAGALVGRAAPRPLPMAPLPAGPYLDPSFVPSAPQEVGYLCPWCGLRVLPQLVQCWNCGGPLQLPPPPSD